MMLPLPPIPPPPRAYFASESDYRKAMAQYERNKAAHDKAFKDTAAAVVVFAVCIAAFTLGVVLRLAWSIAGHQGVLILLASCGLLWVAWVQVRQRL